MTIKRYPFLLALLFLVSYFFFTQSGCGNPTGEGTTTEGSSTPPVPTTTVISKVTQSVYVTLNPAQTVHDVGTLEYFWISAESVFVPENREMIFMQFDISGVPEKATIMAATLEFWVSSFETGGSPTTITQVPSSWDKNTITWGGAPDCTGVSSFAYNTTIQGMCSFKVLSIVQNWVNGTSNNGVRIMPFQSSAFSASNRTVIFDYDSAQFPRIEISYAN